MHKEVSARMTTEQSSQQQNFEKIKLPPNKWLTYAVGKYYIAVKIVGINLHVLMWLNLKNIILNKNRSCRNVCSVVLHE